MSPKEIKLDWGEREIIVKKRGRGKVVECGDFAATLRELEVLRERARGETYFAVGHILGISEHTVHGLLTAAKQRARRKTGVLPSTQELALEADSLELLFPITLLGLASILEKE